MPLSWFQAKQSVIDKSILSQGIEAWIDTSDFEGLKPDRGIYSEPLACMYADSSFSLFLTFIPV
jgi:hypothetical protein